MRRLVGAWVLMGMLGGCQTLRTAPSQPAALNPDAALVTQRARAQALGLEAGNCLQPGWAMAGRMAISNGKDAGAARFEWTQGEGRLQLQLTAPITAQTWGLQSDTHGAQLQGAGHRADSDRSDGGVAPGRHGARRAARAARLRRPLCPAL